MFSVLVGLALSPAGVLGNAAEGSGRTERGTLPRQVVQIRCLAETIVRVATRTVRRDRHEPVAGWLHAVESQTKLKPIGVRGRPVKAAPAIVHRVREALLSLPPPSRA